MGPGDELFTKFGHAALCVTTEQWSPALCFNYGTTDFSRPIGLTVDVLRGRAVFFVSVVDVETMLRTFQHQDRTIYRQTLPLSDEQILQLARHLNKDALPENRAYVYDHFLDNCSTRLRDLIDGVTGGTLSTMSWNQGPTYRDLVDEGLGHSMSLIFLGDLFLGRGLDKETTPYEAMFLPRLLRIAVAGQLGSAPETLYTRKAPLQTSKARDRRVWIWLATMGFALTTSVTILSGSAGSATRSRILAGCAMGGLGTLLLLMAIVSPEQEIRYNENLLVFIPTDLLFAAGNRKRISLYARFRVLELGVVGVLAASGILLQPLWPFWCATLAPTIAVAVPERRSATKRYHPRS